MQLSYSSTVHLPLSSDRPSRHLMPATPAPRGPPRQPLPRIAAAPKEVERPRQRGSPSPAFASPSRFAPPLPLPGSSGPMLCHASTGGPTRANPNGVARASVRAMKAGSTSNSVARASARAMPPMRPDVGIVYLRWSYGLQFPSCCTFFFRFSSRFH